MRLEEVIAYSFGPFSGKRLRLAPGMTVIVGPNEVGKSSWHAALFAGLCGMRRARGKPPREDQKFMERHRPWDSPEHWEAGAIVVLDDNRRIELRHDLVGKAECRARDDLGRDVSGEIMNDGSPDGSKWVGLDRRSFLSTAFVRQADVLQVLNDASFQEHLQRAAATARGNETARAALDKLEDFRLEHVGSDRAPTKPLRRAQARLEEANRRLEETRKAHEDFSALRTKADESDGTAARIECDLNLLEAAKAKLDAETSSTALARARELSARFPDGAPPPESGEDDALERTVDRALQAWDSRPEIPILAGPTSDEIRSELAGLPSAPSGDLEPDPEVLRERRLYEAVKDLLELHRQERPTLPPLSETVEATEQELRDLAREFEAPRPNVNAILQSRYDRKRLELDSLSRRRSRRRWVLLAASGVMIAGAATVTVAALVPGLVLVAGGAAAIIWCLTSSGTAARLTLLDRVRSLENQLGEQRHAVSIWTQRNAAARTSARALGIPEEPESLRRLADQVREHHAAERDLERWAAHNKDREETLDQAAKRLKAALFGRGHVVSSDLDEAVEAYVSECGERRGIADKAAQRPYLEKQLVNREEAERARDEAMSRRSKADELARKAAVGCGDAHQDLEELVAGLRSWQSRRAVNREELKKTQRAWAELQALLNFRTIDEMEVDSAQKAERAEELAAKVDPVELGRITLPRNVEGELSKLRKAHSEAVARAGRLRGQAEQTKAGLGSVAEAEEEVAAAVEDLDRIRSLGETIECTKRFLERAQDRIHRTIAPLLNATLNQWLPSVTSGRYEEARVDPETLAVEVRARGGRWRSARLLSHGTAEQVYLLLRIAMVEHLTNKRSNERSETCPIVLDDVVVQCDPKRKKAILALLHEISRARQVVLFTMEEDVADWARDNLGETRDLLEYLDATGIPP